MVGAQGTKGDGLRGTYRFGRFGTFFGLFNERGVVFFLPDSILSLHVFTNGGYSYSRHVINTSIVRRFVRGAKQVVFHGERREILGHLNETMFGRVRRHVHGQVVRGKVGLLTRRVTPPFAVYGFVYNVLPGLTSGGNVKVFNFRHHTRVVGGGVQRFVHGVGPPTTYTTTGPLTRGTIFTTGVFPMEQIFLIRLERGLCSPPTFVVVKVVFRFVPTMVEAIGAIAHSI